MAELLTIRRKETGKALFFDGTNKQEVKENFLTDDFFRSHNEQEWFDSGGEDYVWITRPNPVNGGTEMVKIPKGNYIVSIFGQIMALSQETFETYFEIADETIV